jgi:hypothetical protein
MSKLAKYSINKGNERYAHVWYSNGQLHIQKFGKKKVFQIDENALPHLMRILIEAKSAQTHTS